jgi:hypothetical protein
LNCCDTDVLCDDAVALSLQYSTQWNAFAHIGSRFDANGDGNAETLFYNGYRGIIDIVPGGRNRRSYLTDAIRGPVGWELKILPFMA